MMTISSKTKLQKGRKLIFQLTFGGLIGGIAGYFGTSVLRDNAMTGDQLAVIGVGTVYLVLGVIVGFGLIVPKLSANILNVEDADEIKDQRRILTGSAICMSVLGAAVIALPLAGPDGSISPQLAFGGFLAALIVLVVITFRDWSYYDEMMWRLSRDAGNIAFCGIGGVLLIWSAAASLALVAAPTSLAVVAIITGGFLLAICVASARLGLLVPR